MYLHRRFQNKSHEISCQKLCHYGTCRIAGSGVCVLSLFSVSTDEKRKHRANANITVNGSIPSRSSRNGLGLVRRVAFDSLLEATNLRKKGLGFKKNSQMDVSSLLAFPPILPMMLQFVGACTALNEHSRCRIEYQNEFTTKGGKLHDAVKGVMKTTNSM